MKSNAILQKSTLVLVVLFMASCGTSSKKSNATDDSTATEMQMQNEDHSEHTMQMDALVKEGPEYTSKYVCPMHCEGSGSDTEGKCPVCGMTYVLNENYTEEGNHSEHNH
jgi:rubrerythrin